MFVNVFLWLWPAAGGLWRWWESRGAARVWRHQRSQAVAGKLPICEQVSGFGTRDTRTHKTKSFCVFSSCLWMISVSQHNTSCSTAWEPALVMGECLLMVITCKNPICQCQQGWEKRFRLFRAGAPLKYKDIRNTSGQWPSWLSVNVSRTSFGIYGAILTNLHNITSFHWFCVRIVWFIRSVWTSGLGSNGNSANWSDLGCRDLRVRFKDMGNSRFKWYGDCQHFL